MPGRPMRPLGRPGAAPARPQMRQGPAVPAFLNRVSNPVRSQARSVKREATNVLAQQIQNRPRPVVRPAAPPLKVMPRQPVQAPKIVRPVAPAARPVAGRPVVGRPAAGRPSAARPAAVRPGMPPAGAQRRPVPTATPVPPGRRGAGRVMPPAPIAPIAASAPLSINSAGAAPEIAAMVLALNNGLTDLSSRSSFTQVQTSLSNLDTNLQRALDLLEGARDQDYVYQNDLEEIAYQAVDRWETIRTQVQETMVSQSQAFHNRLAPLSGMVGRINLQSRNLAAVTPLISSTQSQVNTLLNDLNQIQYSLQNQYDEIESAVNGLIVRLTQVHWALKQVASASFRMQEHEGLVMAVPARWDQEGSEDPEGILYLTNKRLVFEQKEQVATKKVLFIALSKELVQQVLIDQPLAGLKTVKAVNKGLFGHQDFIQVDFSDPKLGSVAFHLNGQDCKQWVAWIESARSGEIEMDRFTGGSISVADLTGPLTTGDLMAVQNEVNGLQEEVMLKTSRQELSAVENDMRSLERKLAGLRARGFVIEKSLEADVVVLATQWDRVKANAEKTIATESQLLSGSMQGLQQQLANLMALSANLAAARPRFIQLKSAIASLDAQADAAEATVIAQYDEYADEVETFTAHLEWVAWMLDAIDTASFKLFATESGVAAVDAVFARPGMEPENGVLFLTDQRLLWEDRVGDFELKVQPGLSQIIDVKKEIDEETGTQFLAFSFAAGVDFPAARFTLSLPVADDWLKMVGRARSGGYTQDRAVEIDQAELDRIRNAPQQCSNCGAALSAPILRGQTEIPCEYCGVTTRI